MLSIPHMLVVFVIVLVVFGPQKLPELARSLGKLMAEFRKASADFRGAFEQEMKDMERQVREVERKKAADAAAKAADEAPVQAATAADAFGEPIDARVTEGTAELVVTPVAEAVARSAEGWTETATEGTNGAVAERESAGTNVNGDDSNTSTEEEAAETKPHVVSIDVPHDQQPA